MIGLEKGARGTTAGGFQGEDSHGGVAGKKQTKRAPPKTEKTAIMLPNQKKTFRG